MGKLIGFDAYALGVSSCIGIDAFLVRSFFICDVDAPTFRGAMDFCNSSLSVIYLALSLVRSASHLVICSL
jgi:hypothetical protein